MSAGPIGGRHVEAIAMDDETITSDADSVLRSST